MGKIPLEREVGFGGSRVAIPSVYVKINVSAFRGMAEAAQQREVLEPQILTSPDISPDLVAEYLRLPGASLDVVAQNPYLGSDLCMIELGSYWPPGITIKQCAHLYANCETDFWLRRALKKRYRDYIKFGAKHVGLT